MKVAGWVASVAVAFVAGWGIGRGGSSGESEKVRVPPPAEAAKTPAVRSEAKALGRRLREVPQDKQLGEWDKIPRDERAAAMRASDERAAAMRARFGSFGFGGPSAPDMHKMRTVIDRGAVENFDGAWQWAESLVDPVAREFAVVRVL